jgi:hypothetical protein
MLQRRPLFHRRYFFLRYFSTTIGLQGIGLEVQLLVSGARDKLETASS